MMVKLLSGGRDDLYTYCVTFTIFSPVTDVPEISFRVYFLNILLSLVRFLNPYVWRKLNERN